MKKILSTLFSLTISLSTVLGDENQKANFSADFNFNDPRQTDSFFEWIEYGREIQKIRQISQSILIICWMPNPHGKFNTYQISGIEGYFPRERIEAFLESFYAREQPKEADDRPLNVIVAGNNWGAGRELKEKLQKLSKENKFTVFLAGGWAFQKAVLIKEPVPRLKMIREAFEQTTSSEQIGADQPATAPQSKPEEGEKSASNSDGWSQ